MAPVADGDWIAALAEVAQQQGPEAEANYRAAMDNLYNTVGQQNSAREAAAGGGTWIGDNYFAASTPQAAAARTDARIGTDLSWLDPAFQQNPALLNQSARSGVYSDPAAQQAQMDALTRASQLSGTPLQFQGSGQQQALSNQWAGIQGGQGAPQFTGSGQQQQLMQQLLGVRGPQFSGDADQRAALNQALGMGSGANSLQFESPARQAEQYGNLQDIIRGGGATGAEMANRQRVRAENEAWTRGQREADMADYAERGLTGSGMELLSLSADRQAAAGRNSQADLDTMKALEERRLSAINSAAGLAGTMRGNTATEQSLLNQRQQAGLSSAASLANAMRGANYNEQTFLNESQRQQALQAAGIAETMRSQDTEQAKYLDQRTLNALQQQQALAGQMRDQTYQEQVGGRNAQQQALQTQGDLATSLRNASFDEASYRANATDQFSQLNQAAINSAQQANQTHLSNAYQQMMNNRLQWQQNLLNQGINVAQNMQDFDQSENQAGFNQANNIGTFDANAYNNALAGFNNALTGQFNTAQQQLYNNTLQSNQDAQKMGQLGGQAVGVIAQTAAGGAGGGNATGALGSLGGTGTSNASLTAAEEDPTKKKTG